MENHLTITFVNRLILTYCRAFRKRFPKALQELIKKDDFFLLSLPKIEQLNPYYSMKKTYLFYIIFISMILTLGCTYSAENLPAKKECIKIALPVWPPKDDFSECYPPLSRWKINIRGAEIQEAFYTKEESVTVYTDKNRPFCLLAQPLILSDDARESDFFKPAGFIYSSNKEAASWEEGFLASLMNKLFSDGIQNHIPTSETEYLISIFNWKKASQSMQKKVTDSPYNPWLLDSAKILEGINTQEFKSGFLNMQGVMEIEVELPLLSSYIPENSRFCKNGQFLIKKDNLSLFYICNDNKNEITSGLGLIINCQNTKKVSLEFIFLPIYIEDI